MAEQIIPIRSTTQEFIEIEDINHDIVMYRDGACSVVINVAAVNFGLLSEKEQESIIYSYAGLLNSLSFPIQLIVKSIYKDITSYLSLLEEQEKQQKNPKLAASIHSYRKFVESTVKEKDVLDKKFYLVIPFSALELGISTSLLLNNSKKKGLPYEKAYIFERALLALTPKRDHMIRLLTKIGLKSKQLTNEQLAALYFSNYNAGVPVPQSFGLEQKEHMK